MRMFASGRTTVTVLLCSGLGACAGGAQVVEKAELSRNKTIGVISAFGDKFRMAGSGFTVFQNRISENSIPEWKIDDEALSITKRVLEGKGAYRVVPIVTDRQSEIGEANRATLFRPTNLEPIQNVLRSLKAEPAVDAFIVLEKHRDDRGPWRAYSSFSVEGVGIYAGPRQQMPPLPGETELRDVEGPYGNRLLVPFAFYRISVFRASDFAPIGSRIAEMPGQNRGPFLPPSLPFSRIHSSAYKDEFEKLTDDDKRVIRKAISDLLEASIPQTLKELGLAAE